MLEVLDVVAVLAGLVHVGLELLVPLHAPRLYLNWLNLQVPVHMLGVVLLTDIFNQNLRLVELFDDVLHGKLLRSLRRGFASQILPMLLNIHFTVAPVRNCGLRRGLALFLLRVLTL